MTTQETRPARRPRAVFVVLKWVGLFVVAIVVLLLASSLALQHAQVWLRISDAIRALRPVFIAVHLALLGLLWHRWALVIDWAYRRSYLKEWQVRPLLGLRTRICGLLLLLEVVLVIRPFEWF